MNTLSSNCNTKEEAIQIATQHQNEFQTIAENVIVENIYMSSDLSKATVIYAARDNSGNVSKISYIFDYNATEEELEQLEENEETQTTADNTSSKDNKSVSTTTSQAENETSEANSEDETEPVTVEGG